MFACCFRETDELLTHLFLVCDFSQVLITSLQVYLSSALKTVRNVILPFKCSVQLSRHLTLQFENLTNLLSEKPAVCLKQVSSFRLVFSYLNLRRLQEISFCLFSTFGLGFQLPLQILIQQMACEEIS